MMLLMKTFTRDFGNSLCLGRSNKVQYQKFTVTIYLLA